MKNFEGTRKQRMEHLHELLTHEPTTDILQKVKSAQANGGILTNVTITPEVAQDLLTLNHDNRPPDFIVINRYKEMMTQEKWFFTGDVIRISKTDKLIDAQQRLSAIVESGVSQVMHIQTGIEDEAFAVIDSGRTRSAADALALAGYKDVNVLAAAIKATIYMQTQGMTSARVFRNRVNPLQLLEWTHNERNLKLMQQCVEYAIKYLHSKGKFLSQSTWAFLYYAIATIRGAKQDATNFVTLVASGENVSLGNQTSSIYLLREKMQSITAERYVVSKVSTDLKIRYFFTAWNLYRKGEVINKLTIDTKSAQLPKPI